MFAGIDLGVDLFEVSHLHWLVTVGNGKGSDDLGVVQQLFDDEVVQQMGIFYSMPGNGPAAVSGDEHLFFLGLYKFMILKITNIAVKTRSEFDQELRAGFLESDCSFKKRRQVHVFHE